MRYLGLTDADRRSMLEAIGVDAIDALYRDVFEVAVLKTPLSLPGHTGEMEIEQQIAKLVSTNCPAGDADIFHAALVNAPRGRFDETEAAKPPILRWHPDDEISAVAKQSAG